MKKISILLTILIALPLVLANGVGCEGADLVLDVDIWVVGENCHNSGRISDSVTESVPKAGTVDIIGIANRGNPGQCQTNEAFYLEINGKDGPVAKDDNNPCLESVRVDNLGEFDFNEGNNEIFMHTASKCPPDTHVNSVDVSRLCIYYKDIPGCTDKDAINYNPKATEDDGSCDYYKPPTSKPPNNGVPEFSTVTLLLVIIGVTLGIAILRKD